MTTRLTPRRSLRPFARPSSCRRRPSAAFSFLLEAEDVTPVGNDRTYRNLGYGSLDNGVRDRPVIADPALTAINQAAAKPGARAGRVHARPDGTSDRRPAFRRRGRLASASPGLRCRGSRRLPGLGLDASLRFPRPRPSDHRRRGADGVPRNPRLRPGGSRATWPCSATCWTTKGRAPWPTRRPTGAPATTARTTPARRPSCGNSSTSVQSDWADHPGSVDLDYQKTGIGFTRGDISVRAVREALDGDGTYGFRTPLATLHGFNGWTDKFLGTPANGLVDFYLRLDHNLDTWNWTVRWHQFRSAVGSMDYGSEIDAMAVWNTPWKQDFGIKLAQYDADEFEHRYVQGLGVDLLERQPAIRRRPLTSTAASAPFRARPPSRRGPVTAPAATVRRVREPPPRRGRGFRRVPAARPLPAPCRGVRPRAEPSSNCSTPARRASRGRGRRRSLRSADASGR